MLTNDLTSKDLPKAKYNWLYITKKVGGGSSYYIQCPKCIYVEPVYRTHSRNYCPNCGLRLGENYTNLSTFIETPLL